MIDIALPSQFFALLFFSERPILRRERQGLRVACCGVGDTGREHVYVSRELLTTPAPR